MSKVLDVGMPSVLLVFVLVIVVLIAAVINVGMEAGQSNLIKKVVELEVEKDHVGEKDNVVCRRKPIR